ncbi:MAG: cadherin-like beta sandwich domain-containing protein [Bacillota bacterium]
MGTLTASAGTWSQPFDPEVLNYTLTLDEFTKKVKITDTAESSLARVSPRSKTVSLSNNQTKVVKITVKAQSGAKQTYVITVFRRPSTDMTLKYLKTSTRSSPLTPVFSAGQLGYTVTMPASTASTSKVTLSFRANGYKAYVMVDGVKKSSYRVTLAAGQTAVVRVKVIAQAGNSQEYVITVMRP